MKLEDQVCSLELAKRLKELGVKQDSLYYWDPKRKWLTIGKPQGNIEIDLYSAFTVAELGEKLGPATDENLIRAYGHIFNVPDTRFITATGLQACMTRPDLGAKMLIYLLENKLITL